MNLPDDESKELLQDGRDAKRRDRFRLGAHPHGPLTFEAYIAALDDIKTIGPASEPRHFVAYTNVKL
jgi:hypothetical protein